MTLRTRLPGITLVRAPNPGPMTLQGTNTWVLAGPAGVLVIDPGPLHEAHLQSVARAVGSEGRPVAGIVVTHSHLDHSAGAGRLGELLSTSVLGPLADGQPLPGGTATVLLTPGHTADSLCIVTAEGVLTGDTILGAGTTVLDIRAGGDLRAYLDSLDRLASLGDRVVLPGHGPALPSVEVTSRQLRKHRLRRVEDVRAALAAGAVSAEEVVDRVYPRLRPDLRHAAVLSTSAAITYLSR